MAGQLKELDKAEQVSHGLNLWLELNDGVDMGELLKAILEKDASISLALTELHYVHFARFLPTRDGKALLVITEFDGDLDSYVMDFALAIGDVFDLILAQAKYCPAHLPVRDHPAEFLAYIKLNNTVQVTTQQGQYAIQDFPVFSAYPDKTVLDIAARRLNLPPALPPTPSAVPFLADIQGNILRGYNAQVAKHFALRIADRAAAGLFLQKIVTRDLDVPKVTTAVKWEVKPPYAMNVGFTFAGLQKLGLAEDDLKPFDQAFKEGPANKVRCKANGDIDADGLPNASEWILGKFGQPVHVLLSVYAFDDDTLLAVEDSLTELWRGALDLVSAHEARALENGKEERHLHFGYRDGISQPRFACDGAAATYPDMLPDANVGDFLLGEDYTNQFGGKGSLAGLPPALAQNATFAAVRVLEQDVSSFEALLNTTAAKWGVDPEWVAARLMGRWRNGTPLSLSPDHDGLEDPDDVNRFDYAPSQKYPANFDDVEGLRCPIGAHMRRLNPRSALVAGKPHSRRILRRGMPYTVARDPKEPEKMERGLFGFFICADLERQFEFMMAAWVNGDISASGVQNTQDPIMGAQQKTTGRSMTGEFKCLDPRDGRGLVATMPRLVTTRGSLYLFMPGINGIRYLAATEQVPQMAAATTLESKAPELFAAPLAVRPVFDPLLPEFIVNPYPTYAKLRGTTPVVLVNSVGSYWVFSHEHVKSVCDDPKTFLKTEPGTKYQGDLLTQDLERHGELRGMLDADLLAAIKEITLNADKLAEQLLASVIADARKTSIKVFNFVPLFARRFTRESFRQVLGVTDAADWQELIDMTEAFFDKHKTTLPVDADGIHLSNKGILSKAFGKYLIRPAEKCPAGQGSFTCGMKARIDGSADASHLTKWEYAANMLMFTLAGYKPAEGLIASGAYLLLRQNKLALDLLSKNPDLLSSTINEVLRYNTPLQCAERYAAAAIKLGGVDIPAGAQLTLVFGSANRDAKVFGATLGEASADVFDIKRKPGADFGFGWRLRNCIGEQLARIVAGAAFKALVAHSAELDLVNDPSNGTDDDLATLDWMDDPYFHLLQNLPVRVA